MASSLTSSAQFKRLLTSGRGRRGEKFVTRLNSLASDDKPFFCRSFKRRFANANWASASMIYVEKGLRERPNGTASECIKVCDE